MEYAGRSPAEPTRPGRVGRDPPGGWRSYQDVGQLVGAKAATIASLLQQETGLPNVHRLLATGGVPAPPQVEQALAAHLSADEAQAVTDLMETWEGLGGVLDYRTFANQALGCRLFVWERKNSLDDRWPLVIYPQYGTIEVVFQNLRTQPPFDDADLRLEPLKRLNQVPGIDLPEAALERRPSFPVSALTGESREIVRETLEWFLGHCREWLAERR